VFSMILVFIVGWFHEWQGKRKEGKINIIFERLQFMAGTCLFVCVCM
jgi:hypothetical protein